jgi:hypothetical protein
MSRRRPPVWKNALALSAARAILEFTRNQESHIFINREGIFVRARCCVALLRRRTRYAPWPRAVPACAHCATTGCSGSALDAIDKGEPHYSSNAKAII